VSDDAATLELFVGVATLLPGLTINPQERDTPVDLVLHPRLPLLHVAVERRIGGREKIAAALC
jgi:hypothetical protein